MMLRGQLLLNFVKLVRIKALSPISIAGHIRSKQPFSHLSVDRSKRWFGQSIWHFSKN